MEKLLCLACIVVLTNVVYSTQQVTLLLDARNDNTVTFICHVSPVSTIAFFLNGTRVESLDLNPSPMITSNRMILEIVPSHEGYFTCGSPDGSQMSDMIEIIADPSFSKHTTIPFYYVGCIGSQVTLLNLLPVGSLESLYTYTWLNKYGVEQNGIDRHTLNANHSLSISDLQPSDTGLYALRVSVRMTDDSVAERTYMNSSYWLHVQELPRITNMSSDILKVQPADGTALTTTISCSAQGYPDLTITWMHNNMPVLNAPDKYAVQSTAGQTTSTLTIMDLNSTDNGMLTCTARIEGCDPLTSYVSCNAETFPASANSKISILTDEFEYEVIILNDKNIELRLDLGGRPIPESIRVFIRYMEENTNKEERAISPGTYTNTPNKLTVFIPNSIVSNFTRFKIQIALGTDADNVGPYISPTRDTVYDIDDPDKMCTQWIEPLIIAIATMIIAIIAGVIALIVTCSCKKHHLTAQAKDATIELIGNTEGEKRMELFMKWFPKTMQTLKGCLESTADGERQKDERRIVADSSVVEKHVSITTEWLQTADEVLSTMTDNKKKKTLMHLLSATIDENNLCTID